MKNVVIHGDKCMRLAFYLAMEEYVAGKFSDDMFFSWRSEPTVIIGRNQILENEVNMDYCRSHPVTVVRRRSGGGCVYSDPGNIMFSYICRRSDVNDVFDRYLASFAALLQELGLPAERSGRNDILVGGRKISGNAFQMLPDRCIVHGTLLYSTDIEALGHALLPPADKLARHGVESVRQRVGNLSDYVEVAGIHHEAFASVDSLMEYVVNGFCDGMVELNDDDIRNIEAIEKEYLRL